MKPFLPLLAVVAAALWLAGCATTPGARLTRQVAESVVLVGEEPAHLAFLPARGQPVRVRSGYVPGPDTVEYVEARDFILDFNNGTLRRTADSRLPDFQRNNLFGQDEFDHSRFPGFGNGGFFAFVDYTPAGRIVWPRQANQSRLLPLTCAKLRDGEPLKIVAFGDSITAGGDATSPNLVFWQRWADELGRHYPRAAITAVNGATGGDSTVQGLQRLQTKVLDANPDLVLLGFGMNDHNKGGVPIPRFEDNVRQMISRIRGSTKAEIVLFSAFPPNPKWKFGSHQMQDYATAAERVARENGCAFADVFNNWQALAARKKPEDLLGNNINHPNDFGHWIYYRVLSAMGL